MFREPSNHFDRDLDDVLNRVYGPNAQRRRDEATPVASNPVGLREDVERREQGSMELRQALEDLRGRRERSQSSMRMKEEVEYLTAQIIKLRELTNEIDSLREKLAETSEEVTPL